LIDSDVAPVTLQVSVEEPPALMVEGVAVNDEMTGPVELLTVTVAVSLLVPSATLVATTWYVPGVLGAV
jgi:hypothetical protein